MGHKCNNKREKKLANKKTPKFPQLLGHEFEGQSGKTLQGMCTAIERLLGFKLTELQAVTENFISGKDGMSIIALGLER